jgi:hypothetical protein
MYKEQGNILIESLKLKLVPLGFKYQASTRSFISRSKTNHCSFHLSFIRHSSDFDVVVDLGIRLNAVHDMVDPGGDKLGSYTFGIEIGNLNEGRQRRWNVNSDASAAAVAVELDSVFKEIAIPYFNKYTDMQAAYDLLSGDGWLHCPVKPVRDCVVGTLNSLLRK